jgi:signal transduction histidine kinase
VQREVRTWVELGAPPGVAHSAWVRFIGTAQDSSEEPLRALDPCLEQALAAIPIRLPPLRESPDRIVTLVEDATLAFCEATDSRPRHFAQDALALLRSHPWPGNVSELEAVIGRTLASTSGELVSAASLRFQSEPPQSQFFPERTAEAAPSPGAPPVEPTRAAEPVAPRPREAAAASDSPPPKSRVEPAAPKARFPAADAPAGGPEFQLEVEGDSPELATWRFMDERQSEAAPSSPAAPATEIPAGWTRLRPVPATPTARPSSGAGAFRTPPSQLVSDQALRRFLGAVSHELGDSMAPLRTSAELLPERFTDPEFRALFGEIVQTDSRRIEGVLTRLSRFAAFGPPAAEALDLSALLDGLIEEQRMELEARQILLLRELERAQPVVSGDPVQLRFALEALLRQALQLVKVRGDLYLASRFHPHGLRGAPSIRVLLRFQSTARVMPASTGEGVSLSETALDLLLAEAIVRAHGGRFTLDAGEGAETVTLIDLAASPTASA